MPKIGGYLPLERRREAGRRIADAIRTALKRRRMTVTALHRRTAISRRTLYRILDGDFPTIETLLVIADELGISMTELFGQTTRDISREDPMDRRLREIEDRVNDITQLLRALVQQVIVPLTEAAVDPRTRQQAAALLQKLAAKPKTPGTVTPPPPSQPRDTQ